MLLLVIPDQDLWDAVHEKFVSVKGATVELEYSLAAISKWESKWHVPFHDDRKKKTTEQSIDFIRCMCVTQGVDPNVFNYITEDNAKAVSEYISDDATATWFSDTNKKSGKREIVTAEIIYYWMTIYNIPESYQYWHLNTLITLIRVCAEKNKTGSKDKKAMGKLAEQRRALNAARRKKYHTRG